MNISRDEAQESLNAIHQVMDQTRKSIARGAAPLHLILWGIIWFIGFLASHFIHDHIDGWIWIGLVAVGTLISAYIGFRFGQKVRTPNNKYVFFIPVAFIIYCILLIWIADPSSQQQASTLIVVFLMSGYVIMGIMIEKAALWVGLITTSLALIGYFLFPVYYNLWMAFLAGGTLTGSGLYIRRRWR
jgi:hypothetical protein